MVGTTRAVLRAGVRRASARRWDATVPPSGRTERIAARRQRSAARPAAGVLRAAWEALTDGPVGSSGAWDARRRPVVEGSNASGA
jgi:hypothetical protein